MLTKTPIYLISGPSGAGEDSVIEGVRRDIPCNRVVTTVTRAPRPGESEGSPYYFVSRETFAAMRDRDEFIEWAEVYGNLRGCTRQEIARLQALDKPILWKLDWHGVQTIKQLFPKAVAIFICPPDYTTLERRLTNRGTDDAETVKAREQFSREWLNHRDVYDHVVVNADGELERTVESVKTIMTSNMNRLVTPATENS